MGSATDLLAQMEKRFIQTRYLKVTGLNPAVFEIINVLNNLILDSRRSCERCVVVVTVRCHGSDRGSIPPRKCIPVS